MKTYSNLDSNVMENKKIQALVNEWREGDYSSLVGALCAQNGDPFLIEDEEQAECAAKLALRECAGWKIYRLADLRERKELAADYYGMCQKLDLVAARAVIVFTGSSDEEKMLLCLPQDWEYSDNPEEVYRASYPVFSVSYETDEWSNTLAIEMFYSDAVAFLEQKLNDKTGDAYQDLANHCTGGCFEIYDDLRELVADVRRVVHTEE